MARTTWVTMTRVAEAGIRRSSPQARVDAGMKELNEMTIGRTDDPENPISVTAFEAAKLFGAGSRIPSGPADMVPRRQAGHMLAIDPPVRILFEALASKGPFSNRAPPVNSFFCLHERGWMKSDS
jgi:hypothetical protein